MTREDLIILATNCGMVKTPPRDFKPLWLASDAQLEAFANAIISEVKQNASEFMVKAIKKAVEYEREECAKVCENMERNGAWITKEEAAETIRSRGEE